MKRELATHCQNGHPGYGPAVEFPLGIFLWKIEIDQQPLQGGNGPGREFFRRPGWRDALQERARALTSGAPAPARYETEAEYWARVRADFGGNVADIEREIGRRPHFLAWPGNAFTDRLRRFALEELAIAATTESGGLNRPGDDARWIGRVHIESRYEGTPLARLDELDFIARLEVFAGNGWFLALTIAVGVARRLFRRGARRVAPEAAPEGFRVMEVVP